MRDLIAKIYRPNSVEHSGTAWLASENHALTCFHCIDDANGQPFPADMHYQLKFESGIEVKAVLVAHDANVDVALLKILDHGFPTKGKILFGKLPRGEDWSRYRAYQKTFWESYGYPVGHKLGLTVEGSINAPETPVDGRVGPPETAIQLSCEHGGLGYLNGLSGGAVVHNNTVVGIIRSGPVEFKHKIIHAVSIERIAEVLAPMREIVNKNSSDAIKIVSPNILNNAGFDTAILSGDERRSSKTRTNLCRQRILAHGRDHDVDSVKNRILAHKARIISLTGADGIGKKTLALSTANEFLNNFDADLYPVKSERALIEVGNALGVKEGADNQMTANLIVEIAQQSFLIVIFSADRLVNFRSSIEHLLKHCDNLHIIAVTEKKLGWAGEQEYAVPLLSMNELRANDSAANLAVLPPIRLFLERARLTKPEFEITDVNAMYIVQLCKLTGGSPFGINIVAALSNQMLSKDSFDLLTGR